MREKMVTDRNARVMAHKYVSINLGPVKRSARRHFRRVANREVEKLLISGEYDNYVGPSLNNRLTGYDVA